MNASLAQRLPKGNTSFASIRRRNLIYVDKTDLIAEIAGFQQSFFLARPRRFGKSLLLSTFAELFANGVGNFSGLKIDGQWNDRQYAVARLDFSQAKNFISWDDFEAKVCRVIRDGFCDLGFDCESEKVSQLCEALNLWLRQQPEGSIVLLIDEYDAPLTAMLHQRELFLKVRTTLADFYSVVKTREPAWRFFLLTGITKFIKTGIFSELNICTDLSSIPKYGSLLGYTDDELRIYFRQHVSAAAKTLGSTEEELFAQLKASYDGYCFEPTIRHHVYSPWSVLSFLSNPELGFKNFWAESAGQPSVLLSYFKEHSLRNPAAYKKEIALSTLQLEASQDIDNICEEALLAQSGYLTLDRVEGGTAFLKYPNKEVAETMAYLYSQQLLKGKTLEGIGAGGIGKLFLSSNPEPIIRDFNRMLASLDYLNYSVMNEATLRSFIQVMLDGAQLDCRVESHNAFGRSDLEVDAGGRHWVFEFKVLPKNASASESTSRLLEEASKQLLDRQYGIAFANRRELIRIAAVFSQSARQITAWKQVA